jgi:hypothetical protein
MRKRTAETALYDFITYPFNFYCFPIYKHGNSEGGVTFTWGFTHPISEWVLSINKGDFSATMFSLFMKSVLAATYQNLVHIYTHKSTFTFCNKKKSRFKFSTLLSLKLVSLNIVSQTHSSKKGNSLVDCNFYTYTKEVIQQLVTTIWNFTFFFSLS